MRHLMWSSLILFVFTSESLKAQVTTPYQPNDTQTELGVEACNFIETTENDPEWVIATSDRILRRTLCTASSPCDTTSWYERIENPCYGDVRYFKLTENSVFGAAFSMSALGTGTFDGLYIREGFTFQLYYGVGDTLPYGNEQVGGTFVSIDYWIPYACDGFEPDTFFVDGGPGALSEYSIKVTNTETLNPKVCFRVDCPVTVFAPGHVFVDLYPGSGDQKCETLAYGFYPGSWKIFGGTGTLNNEDTRGWDFQICYDVNVVQYQQLVETIQDSIQNPTTYDLRSYNCTDWAADLASQTGVTLPPFTNLVGISDPVTFWYSLILIGNGGTYAGGKVSQNTSNRALPGTIDLGSPGTLSYGFAVEALQTVPAELAGALGHEFRDTTLSPIQLSSGENVEVVLGNVTLNEAIVSVNWGDGSAFSSNATTFLHQYNEPGTWTLSVGVLNNGAVNRYTLEIVVSPQRGSGQTHTINQTVPTDPPSTVLNQGFVLPVYPLAIPIGFYNTLGQWPNQLTVRDIITEVINP